jgi:hypothetical protein
LGNFSNHYDYGRRLLRVPDYQAQTGMGERWTISRSSRNPAEAKTPLPNRTGAAAGPEQRRGGGIIRGKNTPVKQKIFLAGPLLA